MSPTTTTATATVTLEAPSALRPYTLRVRDAAGRTIGCDYLRTRSAAEHGAHLVNIGVATLNPHAVIGARVMPTVDTGSRDTRSAAAAE